MNLSFKELTQLAQNHNSVWPADLVEGLEEDEPHVCLQSRIYANLICREKEKESMPVLPTLVVPGWNNVTSKGKINWADFENLLFFYALGKIHLDPSYKTSIQKENDLNELRQAIEKLPILKGQRPESAEARVNKGTTYLTFAKSVIDSLINNDQNAQHDLYREIQEAAETNSFNAAKLRTSQVIANRVFRVLQNRYKRNTRLQ